MSIYIDRITGTWGDADGLVIIPPTLETLAYLDQASDHEICNFGDEVVDTFNRKDLEELISTLLPHSTIDTDNEGQLIIYTNLVEPMLGEPLWVIDNA